MGKAKPSMVTSVGEASVLDRIEEFRAAYICTTLFGASFGALQQQTELPEIVSRLAEAAADQLLNLQFQLFRAEREARPSSHLSSLSGL